ncbi:MAG: hypothetical protein KBT79_04050 [Thalassolituus oleivorans]|nr:hypothetical protein [Thalassolituus oleivorans]|tara:strand:+ start:9091 stop:9786 length:696 start_codon:yes stop_codon:yes gene_type:complete
MIRIHSTKKLFAKLPVDELGLLLAPKQSAALFNTSISEHTNPLGSWHANLLTLQRRNCILLVHDETLFPLFIPCLTKPDFKALQWHFEDVLMNTLLKAGASHEHMETASRLLQPLVFDTQCNRSVQGTMNRMAGDIEHTLYFNEIDVQDLSSYRTGAWLAERPCNVKRKEDCIIPYLDMLELLSKPIAKAQDHHEPASQLDVSEDINQSELPDNVVSLAGFKRKSDSNSGS